MFFRSERLFLRPGWPEDSNDLFHAVCDEGIARNLAQVPWPYGLDDALAYVSLPQEPRYPNFLITLPGAGTGQAIGTISLMQGRGGRTEIGYWVARAHWGRGFATEAVRAALTLARTLRHTKIYAAHFHDNPASGRVLRKAGFSPTGAVEECFSRARGEAVSAIVHAIALDQPEGRDGGGDPLMRAA